jgi:hypothetical protein
MNKNLIIHIVIEVVILGAIISYFYNQNRTLRKEIEILKHEIKELRDSRDQSVYHIQRIYNIIGGKVTQQPQQLPPTETKIQHRSVPVIHSSQKVEPSQKNEHSQKVEPSLSLQPGIQSSEEELVDVEDEDEELVEELEALEEDETTPISFKEETKNVEEVSQKISFSNKSESSDKTALPFTFLSKDELKSKK